MQVHIEPTMISGRIVAPSSKSHTIRAFAAALLADGVSLIADPLLSSDTASSIAACRACGGEIERQDGHYLVRGVGGEIGRGGIGANDSERGGGNEGAARHIDTGNSGTTLRLFSAIAAVFARRYAFDGDAQLRARPMAGLLRSLTDLGARVAGRQADRQRETQDTLPANAPFTVRGPLRGGKTSIACPTSQYLSALLFATPGAMRDTTITVTQLEERPYVEMTLQWLRRCGIEYQRDDPLHYRIPGGQRYRPFRYRVEGDYSSATFMLCAALLCGEGGGGWKSPT